MSSRLVKFKRKVRRVLPHWVLHMYRKTLGRNSLGQLSSCEYWEERYKLGGTSGAGSTGRLARFKADFLNNFVTSENLTRVIEWGCGDGGQLQLATYPNYLGIDVSESALELCKQKFSDDRTKTFLLKSDLNLPATVLEFEADLAISLDVLYHLVEEATYGEYLNELFASALRFVVIYSSDFDEPTQVASHVRHRKFSDFVRDNLPGWELIRVVKNPFPYKVGYEDETSLADFFVYRKREP